MEFIICVFCYLCIIMFISVYLYHGKTYMQLLVSAKIRFTTVCILLS